ncbi:MAG: hypothetical protein V7K97_07750 [Nostoc sp.]|uniref:eIF2A-related protein n=1 Tax=Nostoc sp. TaxID=1180 RepID=UPI002FFBAFAD
MSESHLPEDITPDNERVLQQLAWAIGVSIGSFKLFVARCNYTDFRSRLMERLQQQLGAVEIRILELDEFETTLYARIQEELGEKQPAVLMIFGLETVAEVEHLLISTNQVREEFPKKFHFPLVLWVNDEIFKKLIRLSPDFESWATTLEFTIPSEELRHYLRKTAQQWFANNLQLTRKANLRLEAGLKAAPRDLHKYEHSLDTQMEADLESLLGAVLFGNDKKDEALKHYEKALDLWRQNGNLEYQGKILSEIAFCYHLKALPYRKLDHIYWQATKNNIKECLEIFERIAPSDLIGKFTLRFSRILRRLDAMKELEMLQNIALKALPIHQSENRWIELAQDYGCLAEVALANKKWKKARNLANEALKALMSVNNLQLINQSGFVYEESDKIIISYIRSQLLLIIAQSQQHLGQVQEAIRHLEQARKVGNPEYDTHLYIDILDNLQQFYFQHKKYWEAFDIKLKRQSLEQQYGLRAFVGPGRIEPQRRVKPALTQVKNEEIVAPEIAASIRQEDVKQLIEWIGSSDRKLVVIHGQSGVGKSSLISGGLILRLKQKPIKHRNVLPLLIRNYSNWIVELGDLLKEALSQKQIGLTTALDSVTTIVECLHEIERQNILIVLIFDQFEEFLFSNFNYKNPANRQILFDFLSESLNVLSLKLFFSVREDYLYILLEWKRINQINNNLPTNVKNIVDDIFGKNNLYYLGNFSKVDAKKVISYLIERTQITLDNDLIDVLVEDLASDLGEVRPIELQVVGVQLEKKQITTLAQYKQQLGTHPKAKLVGDYLKEVVSDCGEENKDTAELVLYLLTDDNNTRPQKTISELATYLVAEKSKLELVLNIFVTSGLVLLVPGDPSSRYQLVHDYLVLFIRKQQGSELLEKYKQAEAERKKLAIEKESLESEKENLESEKTSLEGVIASLGEERQKKEGQIKIGTLVLFGIIVTAVIVIGGAWQQVRQAQKLAELERTAGNALKQFESGGGQIEALISAIQTVEQELKDMEEQDVSLRNYPISNPLLALQQISNNIRERNQFQGHQNGVLNASFSPDGKSIVTGSADGTARLWNLQGKLLQEFKGHQGDVNSVSFSPDGKSIVTGSADKTARLWDLQGKLLQEFKGHQGDVNSVSFSPDGKSIVTGSADKTARLWDLQGKLLQEFKGHQGHINSISFSPDGKSIVTGSADGTARLWNLQGKLLQEFKGHQGDVNSVSVSPDGKSIVTGSVDKTARLWDLQGKLLQEFKGHQGHINSVNFSPDGKSIVTGSDDLSIRLWNLQGKLLQEFKGHQAGVMSVSFSPNGKSIVTASWDKTARLWNLQGKPSQKERDFNGHKKGILSISYSPDGKSIATASWDKTARLWDLKGKLLQEFKHQSLLRSISYSPDGKSIATASDEGIKLWSVQGKLLQEFKGHEGGVLSVSFSPDGKFIATGAWDNTARLWDLKGKQLQEFKGHRGWVWSVNFSPDGRSIATGSRDGTARLWDLQGKVIQEFKAHHDWVFNVSFSPDGKSIATASQDGTARLWNLQGKLLQEFRGYHGVVFSVSFSPDGKFIATGSSDGTTQLWNLQGKVIQEFKGGLESRSVTFSPDGKYITIGSLDGIARMWRIETVEQTLNWSCDWVHDYLSQRRNLNICSIATDGR